MTDKQWGDRFLERLAAARPHPRKRYLETLAQANASEMRQMLGDDPEAAADRELSNQPLIR